MADLVQTPKNELSLKEPLHPHEVSSSGGEFKYNPNDKAWVEELSTHIDEEIWGDYDRVLDSISRFHILSAEDLNQAKHQQPSEEYLQISAGYERLEALLKFGAINGSEFTEAIEFWQKNKQIPPNLIDAANYSVEVEKILLEGKTSTPEVKQMFNDYNQENDQSIKAAIDRYKQGLLKEAERAHKAGVFSDDDLMNLRNNFPRQDLTIWGAPRVVNNESEMAWAITEPLILRLERWQELEELRNANLIDEKKRAEAIKSLNQDLPLNSDILQLSQALKRLQFARYKELIEDNFEYQRALLLLPLMARQTFPHVEMPSPQTPQEEITTEQVEGLHVESTEDQLTTQKRQLMILVDAWSVMIGYQLKELFRDIINSEDPAKLSAVHDFLVDLNQQYAQDRQSIEAKQQHYLERISQYLESLSLNKPQ